MDEEPDLIALMTDARLLSPFDVLGRIDAAGRCFADDVGIYLADYGQSELRPSSGGDPVPMEATSAGRAFQAGQVVVDDDTGGRSLLWVPLVDGSDRLGVLSLSVASADEVTLRRSHDLATVAAELIVTKGAYGDTYRQVRSRKAMSLAAVMQWQLLPPLTLGTPRVRVAGQLEPAYEVGGDVFDYALNDRCLHAALLDAMGHGLNASVMASVALAAHRLVRGEGGGLVESVRAMDLAIATQFGRDVFVTAQLCQLDVVTGELQWVNAGHPFPLHVRDGSVIGELSAAPNLPLGLETDRHLDLHHLALEPGDKVFFYTDGVVEARREGRQFGLERMVELLERELAAELSPAEVMRRMARELLAHHDDSLQDDATMLLLEWRDDPGRAVPPERTSSPSR